MPELKWEDVRDGDTILIENIHSDLTISGTVQDGFSVTTRNINLGNSVYGDIDPSHFVLLDIIKPEPQLPTAWASVIKTQNERDGVWFHHVKAGPNEWVGARGVRQDRDFGNGCPWELVYDAGKK